MGSNVEVKSTSTIANVTSSTSLPPATNFEFHIDPIAQHFPEIDFIKEALFEVEEQFPVPAGTKVILFSSTESSLDWVKRTTNDIGCFSNQVDEYLRKAGAQGRGCGLLMRFDAIRSLRSVPASSTNLWFVAAHEVFHVVVGNKLDFREELGEQGLLNWRRARQWMHEGTAQYVGFAMSYGANPGSLSTQEIERLRAELKNAARMESINKSLLDLEAVWYRAPFPSPPYELYHRSFLAVTLLVEKFGVDAVLNDYFDNVFKTQDSGEGFQQTFGISEEEFDAEFQAWINSL